MFNPLLNKMYSGLYRDSKEEDVPMTVEERIELNKKTFGLYHGKGKRKKHRVKNKKNKRR